MKKQNRVRYRKTCILFSIQALTWSACIPFATGEPYSDNSLKTDINQVDASSFQGPRAVVKQMAPLVVISKNEASQCCYPANAENHWQRRVALATNAQCLNPANYSWVSGQHPEFIGTAVLPNPAQLQILPDAYITTFSKANSLYQKAFEQVPCWCEYYWQKPYLQAKYWMYWPFNDHPNDTKLNFFDHESDWEHIELRATVNDDGSFKYFYYFDKHGTPEIVIPTNWEHQENGSKSHPIIWAAEGSHVPYEKAGKARIAIENISQLDSLLKKLGITSLFDNVDDSAIHWNTFENLRFRDDEPTNPVWCFLGPWGSLELTPKIPFFGRATDSPRGPAARSRYVNSAEAECFP